jgi:DNA-binding NtrC family response regulator
LSQVRGFAEQSGGGVTVASEIGRGTRATIYLPRARHALASAPAAPDTAEFRTHGRALLVEDNREVAEATRALLEDMGYQVEHAADAETGLALSAKGGFDLMLSDIVMAGSRDGVELARAVRERQPTLPIVLASGYSDALAVAQAEFPLLSKPYDFAALARAVESAVVRSGREPGAVVDFEDAKQSRRPRAERDR